MWSAQCEVSIRAVEASERNQRLLCSLGGTRWAGGDWCDRAKTRERPRCPEAGAANTAAQRPHHRLHPPALLLLPVTPEPAPERHHRLAPVWVLAGGLRVPTGEPPGPEATPGGPEAVSGAAAGLVGRLCKAAGEATRPRWCHCPTAGPCPWAPGAPAPRHGP